MTRHRTVLRALVYPGLACSVLLAPLLFVFSGLTHSQLAYRVSKPLFLGGLAMVAVGCVVLAWHKLQERDRS